MALVILCSLSCFFIRDLQSSYRYSACKNDLEIEETIKVNVVLSLEKSRVLSRIGSLCLCTVDRPQAVDRTLTMRYGMAFFALLEVSVI